MKNHKLTTLLIISFLVLPFLVYPDSEEFLVNEYIEYIMQYGSDVAMSPEGDFIIVWISGTSGLDGIHARKFDKLADPLDEEFTVNLDVKGTTSELSIVMNDLDEFIVAWSGNDSNIKKNIVYAKKYPDNGISEFEINVQDVPGFPSLAMDGDGNFVIVYEDEYDSSKRIFAKKYDRNRNLIKSFQIEPDTTFGQIYPSIAMNMSGNFVVAWQCPEKDGSIFGIFAKRFDDEANPIGEEFQVNTTTYQSQHEPVVSIADNGKFIIVWESYMQDGSGEGVYAQLYDSDGKPIEGEFRVNTFIENDQQEPSVAMDSIGNFVVTWRSGWDYNDPNSGQDGSCNGIFAQRFDVNGNKIDEEFQVNTYIQYDQAHPSVAMDSDGDFIVTWSGPQENSEFRQVYAKHYQVNPITREPTIDIRSNGTTFIPGYNLRIFVTVDCRYAGAVDMFACTQLSGNFYWYPTWDILPVPTELEDEKFDETIVEIKLTEDRPIGSYTFYAAITEHGNPENVL